MCETMDELLTALRRIVARTETDRPSADDAVRSLDAFAEIERVAVAGRTFAAARVAETRAHFGFGYRTSGRFVASRTGTSVGHAIGAIETAQRLASLPQTKAKFLAGALSESQASEISAAASVDPGAEPSLLAMADQETVNTLRERCREVIAAAIGDEDRAERIRRSRFLKHWTDRDGAVRLDGRFAPDDGARLLAVVQARALKLHAEARRSGNPEPMHAHEADALVGLTDGTPGPRAVIHVEVDAEALARGHTQPGERCRIPGIGPIPVTVARKLATDGVVKLIGRDGADVTAVVHARRSIPSRLRTALEARDPVCVVPGCDVRTGLEIDHIVGFVDGGKTTLSNLARLCRQHHADKTHHGWRLVGGPGRWGWIRTGGNGARDRVPRAP
jgi:hypothetical protein